MSNLILTVEEKKIIKMALSKAVRFNNLEMGSFPDVIQYADEIEFLEKQNEKFTDMLADLEK